MAVKQKQKSLSTALQYTAALLDPGLGTDLRKGMTTNSRTAASNTNYCNITQWAA